MTNLAVIGHNNPPEPTPFDAVKARIDDLYNEATLWLDGEPVKTQGQANALNTLENMIREAANDAEALRKAEVAPLDELKTEIQTRFNVLIGDTKTVTGKTVKAVAAVKAALKPYLIEIDNRQREEARKAKEEADAAIAEAQAALKQRDAINLGSIERAEQLLSDAEDLKKDAAKLAAAKPQASGDGRATGLRTTYRAVMTSYREAAAWAYTNKKPEFEIFLADLAAKEVRAGKHVSFQGFDVIKERTI
jgi:hypothetical protein